MSSLNMSTLLSINSADFNKIIQCYFQKSKEIRKKSSTQNEIFINAILNDTFVYNLLVGFVGLMLLITNDSKWDDIDKKLEEHGTEYFNDVQFVNKIKNLSNSVTDKEHKLFLNILITKFDMLSRTNKINENLAVIENRINNIINMYPLLKISKKYIPENIKVLFDPHSASFSATADNGMYSIRLNHSNFQILYDHINDIDICHSIENKYNSMTRPALTDLAKLVILRNKMAAAYNYKSYYKMICCGKSDNTKTIINLITIVNNKINQKCKAEILSIHDYFERHNENKKIKITYNDVKKYASIHRAPIKFHPAHVLTVIFNVFKNYFGMSFERCAVDSEKRNIDIYNVIDINFCDTDKSSVTGSAQNCHVMGKLFVDMYESKEKSINSPIAVKITDKFKFGSQHGTTGELILVANYQNAKCMTFYDVTVMFKEFGYILRNLAYQSKVGLINYDEEFALFLPMVMEHICYDKDVIKMLLDSNNVNLVESICSEKQMDRCFSLKLRCIDAEFDYFLHNDQNFINLLENANANGEDIGAAILKLYNDIMIKNLAIIRDIFELNVDNLHPRVIIQTINKLQGLLYSNIINDIFGYTTYCLIKRNKNNKFRETVLTDVTLTYRELIQNFIKNFNTNSIDAYLAHVTEGAVNEHININTEDTNCFDDNESDNESESDNDHDAIH